MVENAPRPSSKLKEGSFIKRKRFTFLHTDGGVNAPCSNTKNHDPERSGPWLESMFQCFLLGFDDL